MRHLRVDRRLCNTSDRLDALVAYLRHIAVPLMHGTFQAVMKDIASKTTCSGAEQRDDERLGADQQDADQRDAAAPAEELVM